MVTQHADRIGQVKQDQAADDRVERLRVAPTPHIAFQESQLRSRGCSRRGHFEKPGIAVDRDHASLRSDQVGHEHRHVPEPGAEIEHPHPGRDAGGPQQQAGRGLDRGRLPVQARDLLVARSEHVRRLGLIHQALLEVSWAAPRHGSRSARVFMSDRESSRDRRRLAWRTRWRPAHRPRARPHRPCCRGRSSGGSSRRSPSAWCASVAQWQPARASTPASFSASRERHRVMARPR